MSASLEIAIVGMAGRFPGARNVDALWRNLCEGRESITHVSDETLVAAGVPAETYGRPEYVRASAPLADADQFDASFFGYSEHDAAQLDPQHRQFLECAFEAFESAGIDPARLAERVGVYAGSSFNGYLFHVLPRTGRVESAQDMAALLALDKDFLATRVSYKLDLRGPSVAVQTACSTSLVAVHLACQSLLLGECELALAGGVSIGVPQHAGYLHQPGGIASPDGHCRAFDAAAQGTVAGSGVGVVLLRRLDDALADGDPIVAVIKGSAINNDGRDKLGFTAPSVAGQARAIRDAHEAAGVAAESIVYLEAHGTGTPLGDPIEVAALTRAFGASRTHRQYCALGSLKTNLGHLDAAAGVAGLIKAALVLQHAKVPPTLHYQTPNPEIDFASSPFYVARETVALQRGAEPLRAGVSSFGIGGTNAHVVLEQAPARVAEAERFPALLRVSARSPEKVRVARHALADVLERDAELTVTDAAFTLAHGRRAFGYRWSRRVDSRAEALALLRADDAAHEARDGGRVAFLFPGQGSQQVDAGRTLYEQGGVFREELDRCALSLDLDLRALLYPFARDRAAAQARLDETTVTQPVTFALSYALARAVMALGVTPCGLLGHSVGEYVAACLAGTLTLSDALALVTLRGKLMQRAPEGAMLAVAASVEQVAVFLRDQVELAAVNAPERCVLAGGSEQLAEVERRLGAAGIVSRRLRVSRAFHSAQLDGVLPSFRAALDRVTLEPPRQPWISNVTGRPITRDEATDPEYWVRHLRATVRFADGVAALLAQHPDALLLELGAGSSLSGFVRASGGRAVSLLASERAPEALLWEHGVALAASGSPGRRVALPPTPFEHKRYWVDAPTRPESVEPGPEHWLYAPSWQRAGAISPAEASDLLLVREDDDRAVDAERVLLDLRRSARPLARFVEVVRSLAARPRAELLVITSGACDVTGDEPLDPAQAALVGAVRSAALELPTLSVRLVDVDDEGTALREAALSPCEPVVAHRRGQRWLPRLVAERPSERTVLRERGVYLITGGLGGVGRALADYLVQRAHACVALVGRNLPDDLALSPETMTIAADVTDREAMRGALAQVEHRFGALHGVIHAAGASRGGLVATLAEGALEHERHAKVEGAQVLAEVLAGRQLDFVAYCSSLSAWSGGFAQAGYAAANTALEAHASVLRRRGVNAISVALDRFRGVGMAAHASEQLTKLGLGDTGMRAADGARAFVLALALGHTNVVVSQRPVRGLPDDDVATALLARRVTPRLTASSLSELEDAMAQLWAQAFGLEVVDRDADFYALGGESLLALQLLDRVRSAFEVELPLARFFEQRTVNTLARAVFDTRQDAVPVAPEPAIVVLPRRARKLVRGDET